GMIAAAQLSGTVSGTELGKRFDLVGFDPRGIGASEPVIECRTDAEMDAERADLSSMDGVNDVADAERDAKEFAQACAERTEHGEEMLANLGTRDVVRDIDVMRSALGDEKLTYLGYSYGTRIGYTYAETFPGNVRALLLDGAIDLERDAKEFAQACAERTEHGEEMLANLGTRDVVRDIDVMRSALGDEKLTYLGYSYGTRIGYTYAETFPGNVRALLLDGAIDPEQDMLESLIGQAEGFANTFDRFVEWCVARDDCALGRDKAEAVGAYQDLVRPLLDDPVTLP